MIIISMGANKTIFVDTWAWLAIANGNDNYHESAKKCLDDIYSNNNKMVTSDYVLDEVITSLFGKTSHESSICFVETVLQSAGKGELAIERVDEGRFQQAWLMRIKYTDKNNISFTDFSSFIIMQDLNIKQAFTGDNHFLKINLGFEIIP